MASGPALPAGSPVSLVRMDHHINDREFAEALVAAVDPVRAR